MNFLKNLSVFLSRIIVGVVLLAHGWQKYDSWTIDGTADSFDGMGVPWPQTTAQIATYFELAAGVLLILGLLVRLVGFLLFVEMASAFGFAHFGTEVFVADGGWELVGVIGAAGLAFIAAGAGAFSLDYLFTAPIRARKERKEKEAMEVELAQRNDALSTANAGYAPAGAGTVAANPNAAQAGNPNAFAGNSGNYYPADDAGARTNAGADTGAVNSTNSNSSWNTTGNANQVSNNTQDVDPNAPTTQWQGGQTGSSNEDTDKK